MKVIGSGGAYDVYICEVSHGELEKVFDKYYGNMPKLKVGATLNLGEGHDFRAAIKSACDQFLQAQKTFEHKNQILTSFARMVQQLPDPPAPE